ncbi:MAG TPA: hypothetical protein PKE32_03295 [Miltoncostaeaceae bacterium]|nr:hypothetical protein [Miltoncostaeaceae bacterium]
MNDLSELTALLSARRPLAVAPTSTDGAPPPIRVRRGPAPADRLVDGDTEGTVEEHRAAHASGRPSEATVLYGLGHSDERIAARLRDLAQLAEQTGLLRAVTLVPSTGDGERPGSWGVEDLTVIGVARSVLPQTVIVRPDWRLLGAQACQVAIAFGADGWAVPDDEPRALEQLAAAIGRTIVDEDRG